jgi:hypothetical protein
MNWFKFWIYTRITLGHCNGHGRGVFTRERHLFQVRASWVRSREEGSMGSTVNPKHVQVQHYEQGRKEVGLMT